MVMESVSIPGSASKPLGNQLVSPESATASSLFDQFVQAQTIKAILSTFRYMCEILRIKPTNFPNFYPKLKAKVKSWKAQSLWTKFDKRASHKSYSKGKACSNTRVLIIGAGPCGLRAAIEAQLLGAKVVVVEKRDRLTRNNVLHLWPFVIHDLRNLGAKKFFGKFCAGTIDHISIRQLQCILLKVALLLGVEIHESVSFDDLVEPCTNESQEKTGWRALVTPRDHPVAQYEFDVLIGADGKRNTLKGFKRKEFRGKLAIAITANFVNRRTEDEARVEEISGVAFIFNQKFFQELRDQTGIDLENIVYYKDDTHYFVMTAKKTSLLEKGVIIKDYADTVRLLANENVCREALLDYAREAADFSTHFQLPHLDFAVNCQGLADVAMFDFTSMFQAENACRIVERKGYKLLQALVGDSLLEPFWPTGSGCARGFLSSMDTCWMIRSWSLGKMTQTEVLAERESIYRLLAQTTPENLSKAYNEHALDPHSRYPNLNTLAVRPAQVRHLYDSDVELKDEILEVTEIPRRKRKRDSFIHPDTLLNWCQRQIALYSVTVTDLCTSWKNGLALCAIIHRYRPDLINFDSLNEEEAAKNNQLAFDICDREFGIHPVMTGKEMADCDVPDKLTMMSYISQIYDTFRGEIPHIARNLVDMSPEERPASPTRKPMGNRLNILTRLNQKVGSRKRHSSDTLERQEKSSVGRIPDIENDQRLASGAVLDAFRERTLENSRKSRKRRSLERDRALFILNKDMKNPTSGGPHKADLLYVDKKDFNSRVRDLEEKLCRGTTRSDNLSTSPGAKVGRIDRSDWNVKMLEERMKGQSNPKKNREDVPLYNRDIFEDKLKAMDSKLHRNGTEEEPSKFNEFDTTLKKLDLKLKEGNNLETGLKGSNKVSAMAEQLASFLEPKVEHVPLQRTGARTCMIDPQGGSENCHFCGKRVYLMERQSAQGKFFHRGCFKCECCGTSLRLGSYGIDAEGMYSGKFLCMQHFGLGFFLRKRSAQDGEEAKGNAPYEAINPLCSTPQSGSHYAERLAAAHAAHRTSAASSLEVPDSVPDYTRGVTPERVEFENTLELISEDELLSEIDEDEWTDRNFGTSTTEIDSSDEESDFSDEEIYPEDEEKLEEAVRPLTADETRRLAESWKRRYSKDRALLDSDEDDDRSDSDEEYAESNDEYSYEECLSDEQGSTPTECANDKPILKGPEKRDEYNHQDSQEDSGTEDDTEVFSGGGSNEEGSETESELEDDDQLAATHSIPTIVIDESPQNATNEDDEEYFHSLKEQSMQAEKALSDMRSHAEIETIPTQNVEEEATPVELAVCDDTITSTEVVDELINENMSAAVEDLKECYSPDTELESVITDKEPIGRSLGSLDGCSGVEIAQRRNSVESASSLPDLAKISVPPMPVPTRSGSTDSPRAKMMLELKEKYLLGSTGSPEGASKEDTHHQTAEHQPVMKSIMDLISQKQKMLNPAVTLATSGSDVKREIPGLLLNTLYSSSNLNSGIASSATLAEVAAVSEPLNEGLQVDEVQKDVVEECFIESQPGLDLESDAGESKVDVVSDCKDNANMGEHVSEKQNETNGHVESPQFQLPSERDTDLDVDSGEIVTEPLGDVEENLEDSQLDERFITKRKKKKIVDPDASNADVQSTVFTATLIQTGSVDSLDVLESEKPPSKSEAADTSQIGSQTLEISNNVVQSSDSEEDKIWSEKDSDLIDSMSKDLSESMEGDLLGSLPGSNDGRDSQPTSVPRYEGSNFRRFSEKTGPFGGMRDSIDIRKSAQRRRPPLFRGESAGSILDPRSSVELKEAELEKGDKVVLRRKPNTTDEAKNNRNSVHDNLDEIPFVDDESNGQDKLKEKLNLNKSDVYRRPPLQRPMSLVEKSSTSPVISSKRALLLDTPLTNPNIGQTPISVSVAIENLRMMRTVERERAREEARNRARMKTDEELGIRSPTDFSNLKKKWHRQDSKMSDSDSKDGSSLATSPSEEFPSEPSPIAIASFSPSSPKELLILSQSSSSIVTPVSDLTPDDISKSLEESPLAVTPASPSEQEVSVDDVQIDVVISPLPQPTPTLPSTPISDVPIETEQQSPPPVLPPKNRTSASIKDTEKQSEKSHKPKEKKSSIFSRLAAGLGKSESSKSKSKEKEEKSPQGSSTLADLPIKVDGAPKESRFPKLRLSRSKEKAKEKRRQKSIEGSSNTIKDREDSFSSLKTTSSEERDEIRSRERTPSSVEAGEGLSPIKDVERNGISPLRPKEQDISAPVNAVKETEANDEKDIVDDSALVDNQAASYERNKVSPRPILDRQSLIQSMISLSQSPASSSNKCENGVAPKATGDSFSDPDEDGVDERSQASTSSGGRKSKDPGFEKRRKLQRIAQRLYRQQEQKRLRKAQEIQRELEELEVKLKELEEQGVEVERALRGENADCDKKKEEPELMQDWFHLVHDKNVLMRQEQELMVKAKELELEDRHNRLQKDLYERMAIDNSKKTEEQLEEEERILAEMLETVEQRDALIAMLDEDRQRHQEEDQNLERNLRMSGLNFTPKSKT